MYPEDFPTEPPQEDPIPSFHDYIYSRLILRFWDADIPGFFTQPLSPYQPAIPTQKDRYL